MTSYIQRLPAVFQTTTEKKFFSATFDQVLSKKDSDYLAGFLGRRTAGDYNPISDFYIPEPSKDRTWWQLEATAFAETADTTKENILFYQDLLDRINFYGGNTLNQDRLFESEYYSFGPPIDYDMFINYQNYYWVEQGLATISITGVLGSDIIGQASYTTPITATPAGLTLSTGMKIILTSDPLFTLPHTVENIGGCIGIRLVPEFPDFIVGTIFENIPWDGSIQLSNGRVIQNSFWDANTWDTQSQPSTGDYITIERGSLDRNAWSRTNKWVHIDTINATIAATATSFPNNATRALRPIIQFVADLNLFNSGSQFRDEITYGFRDDNLGFPLLLSQFQFQQLNTINSLYNVEIANGSLVCFFNDDTPFTADFFPWEVAAWDTTEWDAGIAETINKYIFIASVLPDGSVFFSPKTSYMTPVLEGDIVFVNEDAPYDGGLRGQTWYFSNDVWVEAFNDKVSINQPPLFQLYDHNGVALNDIVTYPSSNFEGSKIFSYKINTDPGATTDPVLKFPIVYTALGQASDIVFQNNLITDRYLYGAYQPIEGYYYYKTLTNPVLYNNWNLYDLCDCESIVTPPPCNCVEVSKQRVIDQYVVGFGTQYQFALSVIPYGYPAGNGLTPDLIVSVNNNEILPYSATNTSGYTFVTITGQLYIDLTVYLSNLLLITQRVQPVVEIQTYTRDNLDPAATGYFQIPQQLEANPNQEEVGEISGSNLIQHFSSIIANQINFTGVAFGGNNNYKDSRKNRSVGQFILQNVAPALKTMLVSSSDDLDFIAGERLSQDEYTKFKNRYVSVAQQLINQEFNPVSYHNNTVQISAWVGQILKTINISKEFSNAFAYSYMVASGTPTFSQTITSPGNSTVLLTDYIDLGSPKNTLYIYDITNPDVEKILTIGVDYEVISTNLTIEIQLLKSATPITLVYNLYQDPLPTYVPSTPTKLGMYSSYIPTVELDSSYVNPAWVIIGHDGSKTIMFGTYNALTGQFSDYRDSLLLELEKRIYNNIQYKFRNEYRVPLRVESVRSGYFRQTRYTRAEYLDITESYLNKWSAKNRANYRVNDWPTASLTAPVNELWKLYNYNDAVNGSAQLLHLPGNWKGIYEFYYDTIYPDIHPWEMLGFSQQPSWWVSQYGAGIVNSTGYPSWPNTPSYSLMWADLEQGIIRQGPSAIYNPITLLPQTQEMWARPGLSALIPVDVSGEIIPITTLFNVAVSGNPYAPYDGFDNSWVYGDGGPVEQAWMSTSAYVFQIQEFLYLMRPGPFGELLWDTLGTTISAGQLTSVPGIVNPVVSSTNWQYVQDAFYSDSDPLFHWMRPKNADQIVHAETVDSTIQIRFGYQAWVSDRILFLGKDIATTFGQKIRTLNVNLANKLAGFTNKDTTNTYIESITPGATTNTLIIPSTNFDVILHTGQPVDTYSYSGVIVRALADGTFVVYGYDLLNAQFTTLDRSDSQLIDVTVGGTPAEFQYFTNNATYDAGEIVRYNGVYYVSLVTQTVQGFNSAAWQKLQSLPTVGGISVTYKPVSQTTTTVFPYGTIFDTVQGVFDFLIGWGAWLESKGWQFQDVNSDTNQISDWEYSAKQFLFWLNTSWAPDASIQLSPLANSATLIVKRGYPNDVESLSNGVYSILNKFGVAIAPNDTTVDRTGPSITVAPTSVAVGGIYFLQVTASETEHILIFDNTTNFSDVVYDPLLRARQQRLRFNGFRSNGWYGKMEAPGYLIIDNQLVPNFDTIVDAMRHYYDPNVTIDNPSLEDLGRHLIGYESKSYLDNLQVSNDVQYLFYQGAIRQKGTKQSLDKLFRSTKIQSNEIIEVFEEWALKLGNFGNTVEQVSTEFLLKLEQNTGEVIVARLNFIPSPVGFVKEISILNAENTYSSVPKVVISPPDANPLDPNLTAPLRQATAYIVLDTANMISRIDIIDPGYGYLTAPSVSVDSGSQPHNLDQLYSVWQGEITKDTTLDNIVDIDIDQTDIWLVRPQDPSNSLVFPTTDNIEYPIPNAGYVHFGDVNFSIFNTVDAVTTWGTTDFNPIKDSTVWVANTFTEDWSVYKLSDISTVSGFNVWANSDNSLFLRTVQPYLITPQFSTTGHTTDFGNLVNLYINEATAVSTITAGQISEIAIVKAGANYNTVPIVTISGDGTGAQATATIAGGQVTGIVITNAGSGYTFANITISAPRSISGATNYAVGFAYNDTETISQNDGYNYYNLVTLVGDPVTVTDIPDYLNFTNLNLFKSMRFMTPADIDPSYVSIGNKVWVDQVGTYPSYLWTVYTYTTPALTIFRQQQPLINTSLFESASVFNTPGIELVQLPVYDPFKVILPGPAKQNITYMTLRDPARYNVTGDPYLFSENITFADRQVGQLWWDLSNTRYVYYEQPKALDHTETDNDNLVYRRDHWGQLFPGSTVDIYEWVQSFVPPALYTGTGTPRDVTTYVQISTVNAFTSVIETKYYFWVLNTTDQPNIENRTLAALNVALLLQSPKSQGFSFFSPIQQTPINNSYMFYNVQDILAYRGDNIQLQYRIAERNDQKHAQWAFFREGDPNSLVTDQYWNKMVDSLCGYTKLLPPEDNYPNSILVAANLPWDIFGWDIAPWDEATLSTTPSYGAVLPVPDPALSDAEKYGIQYRPRQGMFVNVTTARKIFVQSANNLLQYIPIRDLNPSWNNGVHSDDYWTYTNWYAVGYENSVPTAIYTTLAAANADLIIGALQLNEIVQVNNGSFDPITSTWRFNLYVVIQPNVNINIFSLEQIGIQDSAIKLLDTIYTVTNKYNLSVELRELLNAFRTQVMVNAYIVDQNELFFSMLNFVLSEQKNPDWLFKSSYIYIKENNLPLSQDQLYIPDQISNIIAFIDDAKPYHTQVRDYTSTYVTMDIAPGTASDTFNMDIILQFGPDYSAGQSQITPMNNVDPEEGWDLNQGPIQDPFGTFNWDISTISNVIAQFISGNPVPADFDPGLNNPWPNLYTVSLTTFDPSKIGYSHLYPYTFTFDNLNINNPQTFITPYNIVGIQIGTEVLNYGIDYYVEYNNDINHTYTVYFYNDPGTSPVPVALVWWDGGQLTRMSSYTPRSEIANGFATDNLVTNIDTKLPVNSPASPIGVYSAISDQWDTFDQVINTIVTDLGGVPMGFDNGMWDQGITDYIVLLDNTISFKENLNEHETSFYRNSTVSAGTLLIALPAPTAATHNIDVITIYVDPTTHPLGTDILPNPGNNASIGVWINGERIEYRHKELVAPDTWELRLVARGTHGTAPTDHPVGTFAFVEHNSHMPITSNDDIWNAADSSPDLSTTEDGFGDIVWGGFTWSNVQYGSLPWGQLPWLNAYTNITSVPIGGLWYAQTSEAVYLKAAQGISIP